jgi:hypothetical protein
VVEASTLGATTRRKAIRNEYMFPFYGIVSRVARVMSPCNISPVSGLLSLELERFERSSDADTRFLEGTTS